MEDKNKNVKSEDLSLDLDKELDSIKKAKAEEEEILNQKLSKGLKTKLGVESENDKLMELLIEQNKRMFEEIEKLKNIQPTKTTDDKFKERERKFGSGIRRVIDKNDILPERKIYITRGKGLLLNVYLSAEGSEIYPPYENNILFKLVTSDIGRDNLAENTIHYASYETWSKSEAEYIENSPYFNVTIFDSAAKIASINPAFISMIENASRYVATLTETQILNIAVQYGIDKHLPLDQIRRRSEERRVGKECRSRWSPYH